LPSKHPAPLAAIAFAAFVALPAAAQVTVTDPWVRGTVDGQRSTGAFMKVAATAETALVAASSPVARIVEIHEMKIEGGVMQMRAVDKLALPPGKPVELKPGGYHVMLMGLTQPIHAGDTVPITLTFEDKAGKRTSIDVKATVRPLTGGDATGKPN